MTCVFFNNKQTFFGTLKSANDTYMYTRFPVPLVISKPMLYPPYNQQTHDLKTYIYLHHVLYVDSI